MPESKSPGDEIHTVWRLPFDYSVAQANGYEGTEVEAYTDLGLYFEERDMTEEALIALRRATELDPGDSRALYYFGGALLRAGCHEEAVGALARAAAIVPDHWVTVFNLGKALVQLSRHDEAIHAFSRAVALNPRASSPLVQRAQSYAALGQLDRAIEDCEAALRIDASSRRVQRLLKDLQLRKAGGLSGTS